MTGVRRPHTAEVEILNEIMYQSQLAGPRRNGNQSKICPTPSVGA